MQPPLSSYYKKKFLRILKGDFVKIKKYFYVLRPVLACMWTEKNKSFPPVAFESLLDNINSEEELRMEIQHLLIKKRDGTELDVGPCISVLNEFLENTIEYFGDYVNQESKTQSKPFIFFNSLFRKKLKQIFGSTFLRGYEVKFLELRTGFLASARLRTERQ